MASILVIEDDITFSGMLEGFLVKNGFLATVRYRGNQGLKLFKTQPFDLVLLDYRLPDGNGIEFLREIKKQSKNTPVVIMTSFNDVRTAVQAIQSGATDYILKPVNPDELLMIIGRALRSTTQGQSSEAVDHFMEGVTDASRKLYEHVHLVAPTNLSVIILGESGTGKEHVARMIHRLSSRADSPFVALDCGSVPKDIAASELFGHTKGAFTGATANNIGKFEAANNGTIFLDEVGNLPYEVQIQLLRSIQEKTISRVGSSQEIKINVRIITATNDDLTASVKMGTFREDLFHRLNEFSIKVPALRERGDDLIQFATLFRTEANMELNQNTTDFSPAVMEAFKKYAWPGNLRELRNVVRRAVLFSSGATVDINSIPVEMTMPDNPIAGKSAGDFPPSQSYDLKLQQENQERALIARTLLEVGYNKSRAARMLNIDRKTLYAKMEKYDIQ